MKFLLVLAMKNLARYRKRTIITASAIAFGLMIFVIMDSLLLGIEIDSERNLVHYETASAQIQHPDYLKERDKLPLKYVVENPRAVLAELEASGIPATTRIQFSGEMFMREDPWESDGSMYIKAMAVDPATVDRVFRFKDHVVDGRWLSGAEEGVVLGSWLAEDTGAKVGYPLTIRARTRYGAVMLIETTVVGIVKVPNPIVNRVTVFMTQNFADWALEMDGAVTEIDLAFPWDEDPEKLVTKARENLNGKFGEYQVVSWKSIASDYVALSAAKRSGTSTILLLVFIIAAVGISNTMLMAVFERTRELGMMRSLGMRDRQIRTSFLLEAGGIGLIGGVLGMMLGALANIPLVELGIDYSSFMREMDMGYRILGVMYGTWTPRTYLISFFGGVIMAMIAAFIPTRRALKMEITACLRDE